jgi:LysM repeat protein
MGYRPSLAPYAQLTPPNTFPSFDTLGYGSWYNDLPLGVRFIPGDTSTAPVNFDAIKERYSYDLDGRITSITQATAMWQRVQGVTSLVTAEGAQTLMATTAYDLLGRVLSQVEYGASSSGAGFATYERYDIQYDLRGQVLAEKSRAYQAPKAGSNTPSWTYTHSVNYYNASGVMGATPAAISAPGQTGSATGSLLVFSETKQLTDSVQFNPALEYGRRRDIDLADTYATNSYAFWDNAVQAGVTLLNRDGQSTSSYAYDLTGHVTSVSVGGPRAHVVSFTNDAAGQVIQRSVTGGPDAVTPRQYYYYYNGIQIGASGNNGNAAPDLATSISERIAPPRDEADIGIFRNGTDTQSPFADFDQAYEAVTTSSLGAGPGSYTVRAGETLSTIAATLWGDASLWYKLAEANGLSGGGSAISAGQTLTIPNTLSNMHNTADTFRPYDANSALGDVQPGTPKPRKDSNKNCGVIGVILRFVVAAAVRFILLPVTTALSVIPIIGPALSEALVNVVKQGVNTLVGLQDRIEWKKVGIAAVSAGVSDGLTRIGGPFASNTLGGRVLRAAVQNAATQGISTAVGLQDRFSWGSVAASAAAIVASDLVGGALGTPKSDGAALAKLFVSGAAGVVAAAATQSLIDGSDFGDNIVSGLPGLAATLGLALVEQIAIDIDGHKAGRTSDKDEPEPGKDGTLNAALNTAVKAAQENAVYVEAIPVVRLSDADKLALLTQANGDILAGQAREGAKADAAAAYAKGGQASTALGARKIAEGQAAAKVASESVPTIYTDSGKLVGRADGTDPVLQYILMQPIVSNADWLSGVRNGLLGGKGNLTAEDWIPRIDAETDAHFAPISDSLERDTAKAAYYHSTASFLRFAVASDPVSAGDSRNQVMLDLAKELDFMAPDPIQSPALQLMTPGLDISGGPGASISSSPPAYVQKWAWIKGETRRHVNEAKANYNDWTDYIGPKASLNNLQLMTAPFTGFISGLLPRGQGEDVFGREIRRLNNLEHPSSFDLQHSLTEQELRDSQANLLFSLTTAKLPVGRLGGVGAAERGLGGPASSAAQGARLGEHLGQLEKYGTKGFSELENGSLRYFGDLKLARTPGEMAGTRVVREWNPASGAKQTWLETLDHNGTVRIVRPETGGPKVHYIYDAKGNFVGTR